MYNTQALDTAYDYIVKKIQSGEWKPGDKIDTEVKLCQDIGVSRNALRQAVEKLVALSVLKKIQGSGTFVEKVENMSIMSASVLSGNREQMLSILEFRKMFDSYNIELFIKRCSYSEIIALDEVYKEMIVAKDDMNRFQYLDLLFHDIIAKGTRNPMIIQISSLFMDIFRANQEQQYNNVGPESALKYHQRMLECVKDNNAELASVYAKMSIEESIKLLTNDDW